jgi:hypothetical protein
MTSQKNNSLWKNSPVSCQLRANTQESRISELQNAPLRRKRVFIFKYSLNKKGNLKKKSQYQALSFSENIETQINMNYAQRFEMLSLILSDDANNEFSLGANCEELVDFFTEYLEKTNSNEKNINGGEKKLPKKTIKEKKEEKHINQLKNFSEGVSLFKLGYSQKFICESLGLQINKLKAAINRDKNHLPQYPQPVGRKTRIKPEYCIFVSKSLDEMRINSIKYANDIHVLLTKEFPELNDGLFSISTTKKIIKKSGFSFQKTLLRSQSATRPGIQEERKNACLKHLNLIKEGRKIIYIDEVGFCFKSVPRYAYARRRQRKRFYYKKSSGNITAMVAVWDEGILGLQLFTGNNKGEDFACFLIGLIKNHARIKNDLDKYVFFLDNCSIHTKRSIKRFTKCLPILFNSPHSPFYNPIENIFGIAKHKFRKKRVLEPEIGEQGILDSFLEIKREAYKKTVRRAIKFAYRTLLGENFD